MASLKDMRVRIASTKATQKITKAMQMSQPRNCAARRPPPKRAALRGKNGRGDFQHCDSRCRFARRAGAAGGTGKDQVHLLLVCTGERGLSGAFNSSIVRLARERALSLMNQGKEVKFFCVGRKGYEQLRRTSSGRSSKHRAAVGPPARLRQCRRHRQENHRAL